MAEERAAPDLAVEITRDHFPATLGKWVVVLLSVVLAGLAQHPGNSAQVPAWVLFASLAGICLGGYAWPSPVLAI